MVTLVRAAALRGFDTLVAELGGDAEVCLRHAGIDPFAVADDDALLPTEQVVSCLALAATQLGRPELPLLLTQRQDFGALGALAVGVESAPTVGEALACAGRFLFMHDSSATMTIRPDPRGEAGVAAIQLGPDADPLGLEPSLGLLHRLLLILCPDGYGLRSVHLPGAPAADESFYHSVFGVPVRFRTGEGLLRVPERLLERPLDSRNALVHRMAMAHLETHGRERAATVAGQVGTVLANSLGTSAPLIASVANLLAMHPRTLQRRLAAEGTTFEEVLDEVRRERAHRLIVTTDLPLRQVAGMLGLSEAAALTRACRRWFGAPPRELRRAGRPGTSGG